MMQITEDTPPDMLTGAMDLCIHLPDGRDVKMAVERSTPMMDLLVHVTTAHKLRPSDHVIQALDMSSPGVQHDKVLPYMPNTPIGALDTQHIRVLPKGRHPAPKPPAPGKQPFENTFRLQVHLPRNQFIVIRVGRHVMLEDIMKKVCEEKNLDPRKYEFRHPANLDKVLDPKRTLNDYELTEITVTAKGNSRIQQGIGTNDIMGLQRDEERRKFQSKGGGVLNLIFRKGRSSTGSGSISSDTRSISPTQSDDSRSVTPPAVQPPQILPPRVEDSKPANRPKPPMRKRRPAPKPPAQLNTLEIKTEDDDKSSVTDKEKSATKSENGLTICHSRNSSDSSGYHEASILSDNCTTLPRRPKSTIITSLECNDMEKSSEFAKSMGNLSNMVSQSKSTTSLVNAGRKKKAPPPPPGMKSATSVTNLNVTAPLVARELEPAIDVPKKCPDYPTPISRSEVLVSSSNTDSSACIPQPKPRTKNHPIPPPRTQINKMAESNTSPNSSFGRNNRHLLSKPLFYLGESSTSGISDGEISSLQDENNSPRSTVSSRIEQPEEEMQIEDMAIFERKPEEENHQVQAINEASNLHDLAHSLTYEGVLSKRSSNASQPSTASFVSLQSSESFPAFIETTNLKKWEDVNSLDSVSNVFDEHTVQHNAWVIGSCSDADSTYPPSEVTTNDPPSDVSLSISNSVPSTPPVDTNTISKLSEIERQPDLLKGTPKKNFNSTEVRKISPPLQRNIKHNVPIDVPKNNIEEIEAEWQYQLPSPPTAFRDSSPTNLTDMTNYDTVTFNGLSDSSVTSPQLIEKLQSIRNQTSVSDTISDSDGTECSDKPQTILTAKYLSVENLEKRRSLVLERQLASLKIPQNESKPQNIATLKNSASPNTKTKNKLIQEIEEVMEANKIVKTLSRSNSQTREKILATDSMLPNFKITTYDQPKSKINIFEDDSIRSNEKRSLITEKNLNKRNSLVETTDSQDGTTKFSDDNLFKKPFVPKERKRLSIPNVIDGIDKSDMLSRSESFTTQNLWSRSNPVKRSKSQVSLERYIDETKTDGPLDDNLQKSNSLWNVSGLQSLEVMRMILPKLGNTPPNTPTDKEEPPFIKPAPKPEPKPSETIKRYQYNGPPAINLSTWSERPKSQVSLKEDNDYKISSVSAAKAIFSGQSNQDVPKLKHRESFNTQNYSSVNIKVNGNENKIDSGKVNIKVNSDIPREQQNGNVVIKISNGNGVSEPKVERRENNFYTRFLNQTNYRKPLSNINGVDKPRPHSIAFDASCPDLSRVPIVRAVELKKPFRDTQVNKSVTQITSDTSSPNLNNLSLGIPEPVFNTNSCKYEAPKQDYNAQVRNVSRSNTLSNQHRNSSVYLSSESTKESYSIKPQNNYVKPVQRGQSFAFGRANAPTVKGFRVASTPDEHSWNNLKNTKSHQEERSQEKFLINGKCNSDNNNYERAFKLRSVNVRNEINKSSVVTSTPAPPPMPKVTSVTKKLPPVQIEPRDLLLESIRSFGGKRGLRAVK